MLEQISNAVTFYAHYIEDQVSKTGLTVTVDVWEVQKDGTSTEIVTGGSATEIGDGLYRYVLASGSVDAEGEYICVFKTSNEDVDQRDIPALWAIQRAGVEYLDASVNAVLTDTAEIGAAGAGLTAVPWNSSWDAEVQSEVQDALEANDLDHLIQVSAGSEEPTDGSYLDQVMHKDSNQSFNASTDSLEALRDYITPGTISTSAGTISITRGDTVSESRTDLGSLSGYVSLDFTVKYDKEDTDTSAILRIRKNASGTGDGLLRINGAEAGTASNGSITIDDSDAGDITIALKAADSDDLPIGTFYYDVQMITASLVDTLESGTITVSADVTRLIA